MNQKGSDLKFVTLVGRSGPLNVLDLGIIHSVVNYSGVVNLGLIKKD